MGRSIDVVLPSPGRLEAAVRGLAQAGRDIDVARFVEHWSKLTPPTPAARFMQVEALLSLNLTDAALDRLRDLAATQTHRPELHALTARCWIARGAPLNAQKPITRLAAIDPEDPQLETLIRGANQPAPATPTLADDATDAETIASAVAAALAAGAPLRAEQWLARIPAEHSGKESIARLRWALRSDFGMAAEDFWAIVQETEEFTEEFTEEPEHTDATARTEPRAREEARFPSLFRDVPRPTPPPAEGDDDHTQAAIAPAPAPAPARDAPTPEAPDGDTQVARVIRRDGGWELTGSHRLERGEAGLAEGTAGRRDLRAPLTLRRPSSDLDDSDGLTDDDDERIVRNPRHRTEPLFAGAPTSAEPSSDADLQGVPVDVERANGDSHRRLPWSPWTVAFVATLVIAACLFAFAGAILALR